MKKRSPSKPAWQRVLVGTGIAVGSVVVLISCIGLLNAARLAWFPGFLRAEPTPFPSPTPLPPRGPIAVAAWEGVAVQTLCLDPNLDFPRDEAGQIPDPMDADVRYVLSCLGMQTVTPGSPCDATLALDVKGVALRGDYMGLGGCYTGWTLRGEMRLSAPRQAAVSAPISATNPVDGVVVGACRAKKPYQVSFRGEWLDQVRDGLVEMWGPQVLVGWLGLTGDEEPLMEAGPVDEVVYAMLYLLEDPDTDPRLLGHVARQAGRFAPDVPEAIPLLARLVLHQDKGVRLDALYALGRYESRAASAAPALIEAMRTYPDGTDREANATLKKITGSDLDQGPDQWHRWLLRTEITPWPTVARRPIAAAPRTPTPLPTASPTRAASATPTATRTAPPPSTPTPTATPVPSPHPGTQRTTKPTMTAAPTESAAPAGVGAALALRTVIEAGSEVLDVALSPNGGLLALGCKEGSVQLWNASTGQPLRTLQEHDSRVRSVAFSPDGATLASADNDGQVWIWQTASGAPVRTWQAHDLWVNRVAFSPDGQVLASASADRSVRLWDAASGEELRVLAGHLDWVRDVAFSAQGDRLASASCAQKQSADSWECERGEIRLWDVATGEQVQALEGHAGWVQALSFAPDGRTLASGSDDKYLRVWDLEDGQEKLALDEHRSWINGLAYSPDGRFLASGDDGGTLILWDARTWAPLITERRHSDYVNSVAFAADGSTLATGSADGTAIVWAIELAPPQSPP